MTIEKALSWARFYTEWYGRLTSRNVESELAVWVRFRAVFYKTYAAVLERELKLRETDAQKSVLVGGCRAIINFDSPDSTIPIQNFQPPKKRGRKLTRLQ